MLISLSRPSKNQLISYSLTTSCSATRITKSQKKNSTFPSISQQNDITKDENPIDDGNDVDEHDKISAVSK